MQSLRHASLLRNELALVGIALVLLATRRGEAQTLETEESAPTPAEQPLSPQELDPTRAFADRIILFVRTPGDDGVITRLYADLRQSDWRIVEIGADERLEPPPLGASATREGASAALRVDARRGVIVLWVLRPEGAVEETIGASGEAWDEQILALRGAEVLRARGLLVAPAVRDDVIDAPVVSRAPSPPPVDATELVPARPNEEAALLWLVVGPAVALSPGGFGPLPLAEVGADVSFERRWSVGVRGFLPLGSQSVAAEEGEADVATWLGAGFLELDWARFGWGGLRSGVGGGASVTTMAGRADESGFDDASDTVVAFAPLVSSSFHARMGRSFRLRIALSLGATVPEVKVSFGSREVASFGRPLFLAGVVLESSPARW
jgi:hypothetical protein